ncbi:MAG: thiamine phosphate synthase, partial [Clostridiales bacterium]
MFSYKQTIAITNSTLYPDNYLQKIEEIALLQPWAIILREKNLSEKDYETLAKAVMAICEKQQTKLFLHSYINVAKKLNHTKIHLSLPALQQHQDEMDFFQEIGVSVHSLDQAIEAEKLGLVGTETALEIDNNKELMSKIERIRGEICYKLGLVDSWEKAAKE